MLNSYTVSSIYRSSNHRDLHSFPTRRSSDLLATPPISRSKSRLAAMSKSLAGIGAQKTSKPPAPVSAMEMAIDRKSTRLNSSHVSISYAVFCLKKKKQQKNFTEQEQ